MRIAILHPDLGLGGAERLIVDAAVGLSQKGHKVVVYTCHYNPERSFAETRDGTFEVRVHGSWIPRSILGGKFHILFSMIQNVWLSLAIALNYMSAATQFDAFLCDQVSACVPILRILRPRTGVVFYCHFPDQLLASHASFLKSLYRAPFDLFEQVTTGLADSILVNSKFTKQTFQKTFRLLAPRVDPAVLYPCIAIDEKAQNVPPSSNPIILLSINRFERKKGINIAIQAAAKVRLKFPNVHLIVAGGYDTRLRENVEHHSELVDLARQNGLIGAKGLRTSVKDVQGVLPGWPAENSSKKSSIDDQVQVGDGVTFIRSFTDAQKVCLLQSCSAVIYTPINEHFGIVPLECMSAFRPVIACNSGGPLESVKETPEAERAGYLCEPTAEDFARAMEAIVSSPSKAQQIGLAGRKHVKTKFSRGVFADQLNDVITSASAATPQLAALRQRNRQCLLWSVLFFTLVVVAMVVGIVGYSSKCAVFGCDDVQGDVQRVVRWITELWNRVQSVLRLSKQS